MVKKEGAPKDGKGTTNKVTSGKGTANKAVTGKWMKSKILKKKEEKRNEAIASALYDNKSTEILKTEGGGYLEPEGMERTYQMKQNKLKKEVDLNTQRKIFSLTLDQFGPYKVQFDRPGRHLLLGGEKGHLAMMDALKQDLICEFHVDDRIYDIQFLHDWDMFATAQTKYLHIYDSQGTELHCMRTYPRPRHLEFLPYHYLLVTASDFGELRYLDVSTGETANAKRTYMGNPTCMTQNPHNAVILLGSSRGQISMWSPNQPKSLVTMLCHRGPVLAAAVDLEGKYLVTTGGDSKMKIWDIRTYEQLYEYTMPVPVRTLALSQRNMLSMGVGASVNSYANVFAGKITAPYMSESIAGHKLESLAFRPFEDQLVAGFDNGLQSMVIPGAGEANIDTYELNPYETTKQRRERNVQKLLDKLRPEQIVLNPDELF